MKISAAFELFQLIRAALRVGLIPTLRDLISSPSLVFHPTLLSRLFMSHVWAAFAANANERGRPMKEKLLPKNAFGTVLDIGAGLGHTAQYLDRKLVTRYVALEPNTLMHSHIRAIAHDAGFVESDGSLIILSCGAENTTTILSQLGGTSYPVDTIVSVLSFCSIPSPEQTLNSLVNHVLKPGGKLLFYEHVLSQREDIAWWQGFWSPLWSIYFDGCRLDRPTHLFAERMTTTARSGETMSMWSGHEIWRQEGEPEETLISHCAGCFAKHSEA